MIPLVVIRPRPGGDATLAAARDLGLDAHGFPLFAVAPLAWEPPARDAFDALLLGSANAVRHAGSALAAYAGMPAYAVGAETARAATAAGLTVVATGSGGLRALLSELRPGDRRLLRLAGRERVALAPPPGVAVIERVVYASEPLPLPLPPGLVALLAAPALVLVHSAEAARHFARGCARHAIPRERVALAALGPRIAEAAGGGWGALAVAATPTDTAMLALAARMCDDARPRGLNMHET